MEVLSNKHPHLMKDNKLVTKHSRPCLIDGFYGQKHLKTPAEVFFIPVLTAMRMSSNLITVHAISKMYVLLLFSEILVDGRHAKLVAESVADLSRCVKKLVTVKQVCATSNFSFNSCCI